MCDWIQSVGCIDEMLFEEFSHVLLTIKFKCIETVLLSNNQLVICEIGYKGLSRDEKLVALELKLVEVEHYKVYGHHAFDLANCPV